MTGRPLQFNPDTALNAAVDLFWEKGYSASSLQDILQATRLSKSSLYQTFGNKHKLFEMSVNQYKQNTLSDLQQMLEQSSSGFEFISQLFFNVTKEIRGKNAQRGCLIMNTASEFSQSDPVIAKLVKQAKAAFTDMFEQAIKQAQVEKDIPADKDPKVLAAYLVSSLSGLKTVVKAGADSKEVNSIIEVALSALK